MDQSLAEPTCPLTGVPGVFRRTRSPEDLIASHITHMGKALPPALANKYLNASIAEYECLESGLRWFVPAILGGPDYYEWLGKSFDWYYDPNTWDKREALACLVRHGCRGFLEIGSGDGSFLSDAAEKNICGVGVDVNAAALERCRVKGLRVLHPSEVQDAKIDADTLVLLQSLEHVGDPVGFMRSLLEYMPVERIVVSVPCFEALMGHSSHPLLWPPHHATIWSARALATLAERLRFRVVELRYDRCTFNMFIHWRSLETTGQFADLPDIPANRIGQAIFFAYAHVRRHVWARRFHSVLTVFERVP